MKVGDKVRIKKNYPHAGEVGKITVIRGGDNHIILVTFGYYSSRHFLRSHLIPIKKIIQHPVGWI